MDRGVIPNIPLGKSKGLERSGVGVHQVHRGLKQFVFHLRFPFWLSPVGVVACFLWS